MSEPVKIGVIGCGNISGIYFQNMRTFENLEVAACADLDLARARARADEYGVPRACAPAELLADPAIELVVNLTVPGAHAEVALAALDAGKAVYSEKPLAISREDGRRILDMASARGLRVGGAPDTFLGGGQQTCRDLIDDGVVGAPVAATAFMLSHGPEIWHPSPAFYYQHGGGPLFDMGPYYLTALVNLMGPVCRVTGSTRATFPTRTITSRPLHGTVVEVEVPTHHAAVLDFASGAIATLVTSFDVWASTLPPIELYGTEGSLRVPDPNTFGGPIWARRAGDADWAEIPIARGYTANSRGLGVADMAAALRASTPSRANSELAYHVLDIMHAVEDASRTGRHVELSSACPQPAPLPRDAVGADFGDERAGAAAR